MGSDEARARTALEAAHDADQGMLTRLIQQVLDCGLDGFGPYDSAAEVAAKARSETSSVAAAVKKVTRSHVLGAGVGGFATGVGGFVTLPVALPANVLEFYVQAARLVGAVAVLRGYDVADQRVRMAVLLTLSGADADDVLAKAGLSTGGGRLASLATRRMPPAAVVLVNKAVAFRLLRTLGDSVLTRLGKGVPLVGGAVGASFDGYLMKKIAERAEREFPPAD
ncbi:MAG: EcsC family protein [Nocardioides sp.]|uniref:EcsC family protein n=1 Tax=Nocardioides sp. TaxID=35761 RepID=UPI0039E54132